MSQYLSGIDKMGGQSDAAASKATSAFDRIGGAIAGVGKAAAAFTMAAVVGGVAALTGALVSVTKAAMDAQVTEAQLDAVLKSTGASAAKQAEEYDRASKTIVTSTKLSAEEIGNLSEALETQRLKHSTLGAEIQEQKERVRQLTEQWGDNGLATIKAKNKLAEMENEFKSGSSAIDKLTRALKDGAVPQTMTLAQKLGLVAPAARMTKDELIKLADGLSLVTRYEDDTIIEAESLLLTFTSIGKDIFPMATETVLNMSTALGQDLKSSAIQLGKAMQDPVAGAAALRRVGVMLTDSQEALIKKMVESGDVMGAQKLILSELTTEFGGSAKAAGKTFAGQLDILKNKFMSIQETIGMAILPVLQQFSTALIGVLTSPELAAAVNTIATTVGAIAAGVGETVGALVRMFQGAPGAVIGLQVALSNLFGVSLGQITTWYTGLQTFLAPVIALFTTTIPAALGILQGIWAAVWPNLSAISNAVWTNMQAMINVVVTTVIPLLQTAFAGLVAWFQTNWPAIQTVLLTVWDMFSAAIITIQSVVIPMLLAAFGVAIAWVQTNWPWIQATIETVMNAVLTVITAVINTVAPFIIEMLGKVTAWTRDNWPLISQTITTVLNAVKTVVQAVLTFITDFWKAHGERIVAIATSVWTIIRTVIETVINTILGIIKAVMQVINGDWEGAWKTVQSVGQGIWDAIKVYVEEFTKILANLFAIFYPILKDAWEKAWKWIQDKGKEIWDAITTAADTWATGIEKAVDTMLDKIQTAIEKVWGDIKTWLTNTWADITTMFTKGFADMVAKGLQFGKDVMGAIKDGILAIKLPIPTFRLEWVEGPFGIKIPDIVVGVRWASVGSLLGEAGVDTSGAGGGGGGSNAAQAAMPMASGFDMMPAQEIRMPLFTVAGGEDVGSGIAGIIDNLRTIIDQMVAFAKEYKDKGVEAAATIMGAIEQLISPIKSGIDALSALGDYVGGKDFKSAIHTFLLDLGTVVAQIKTFAGDFELKAVDAAALIMTAIGQMLAPIKAATDALKAIGEYVGISDMKAAVHVFLLDLGAVVDQVNIFAGDFDLTTTEAAGKLMTAIGQIMAPMKAVVDGLNAIATYVHSTNLINGWLAAKDDLRFVVNWMITAKDWFSVEAVAAAAVFAAAVGQIMAPMKTAVDSLNAIATYVHSTNLINAWLAIKDDMRFVVNWMVTAKDWFGVEAVAAAGVFSTSVGQIMAPMKALVDGLTAIAGYVHGANLIGAWLAIKDDLRFVLGWMLELSEAYKITGVQAAAAFSASVGQIMAPIKSLVDGLTAIAAYVHGKNLIGAWFAIKADLQFVLGWMIELSETYKIAGVAAAAAFGTSVGAMLAPMMSVVDGLAVIATYIHGKNLVGAWFAIKADLQFVLGWMLELAKTYEITGVEAAAAFSAAVGKMMAPVKTAVDALVSIGTYTRAKGMTEALQAFKDDLVLVIEKMVEATSIFDAKAVEAAGRFSESAGKVFSMIKTALDALSALANFGSAFITPAKIDVMADMIRYLTEMIAWLSYQVAPVALAAAITFSEQASKVFEFMGKALDFLGKLGEVVIPQQPKIDAFISALSYILKKFGEGVGISADIASNAMLIAGNLSVAGFENPGFGNLPPIVKHPVVGLPWEGIPGKPAAPGGGGGGGGGTAASSDVLTVLKHIDDLVYNILMAATGQEYSTQYGGTRVTPAAGAMGGVSSATTIQYNLTAQYRTMETESQLRDTVRMLEMGSAY